MKKLIAAAVILAAAALFAVGQSHASTLSAGAAEFNTSAPPSEFTDPIYATPQGCTYLRTSTGWTLVADARPEAQAPLVCARVL